MKPRTVRPAGFTLVELLMVILIIGMLVTLLSVAVGFAITAAKRTGIKVEVSNLDAAMQDLSTKSLGGEYPPCMAVPTGANPDRYGLLNRMLRKRFPRSTQSFSSASSALPWLVRHGDLQNSAYDMALDFANMDAAEALVFWLAGPPAPGSAGSSTILYGFSANATTPFAAAGSRLAMLYSFDETRLTDRDNDGWPEYTPPGVTKKVQVAAYVYFDAAAYKYADASDPTKVYAAAYPGRFFKLNYASGNFASINLLPSESSLMTDWGVAVPYADTATPTAWNVKKFQIICSGLDSEYGGALSENADQFLGASPSAGQAARPNMVANNTTGFSYNVPLVPKPGTSGVPSLLQGELDNQTNFTDGVLEDATGQ